MDGSAEFDLWPTSGAMDNSDSAAGSASLGGNTVNAYMDVEEMRGDVGDAGDNAPQDIYFSQALSGWSGTFTVSYSATLNVGDNGAIGGRLEIYPPVGYEDPAHWVYITSPAGNSQFSGASIPGLSLSYTATVPFAGVWKEPLDGAPVPWQVNLVFPEPGVPDPSGSGDWISSWAIGVSANADLVWNPWSLSTCATFDSNRYSPATYPVTAQLQYLDPYNGQWLQGNGTYPGDWNSSTYFTINNTGMPPGP